MKLNYLKYIAIKEQTFNIFELYHHQALVSIFKHDVTAKDLSLIKAIHDLKEATPSDIVVATGISATNLSNRLNQLETQHLIVRSKQASDMRKNYISLTNNAVKIIEEYQDYVNGFIDYVKRKLSLGEKLAFNHFLTTWSKSQPQTRKGSIKSETGSILDNIQNYFLVNETAFLESLTLPLAYADLSFLGELYLNQVAGGKTLPKLADYLFLPYQTVISKINRFIQEGYIVRDKKNLIFSDELIHILDHFMVLRIFNYYEVLSIASPKEYQVVLKVFSLLKEYAETFINK